MTMSSLLIQFNQFSAAEWFFFGLFMLVAVFAFIKGYKKGFVNLKLRTLSWAFGCLVFVGLEVLFHDKCFANNLFKTTSLKVSHDEIAGLVSTMTWLAVALLARWVVFGLIHVSCSSYKAKKLKKAAKIAVWEKETGEEYLPDENKVYKPLPVNGVVKSGPLGRLFGGLSQAFMASMVLALILAVLLVLLGQTAVKTRIAPFYKGELGPMWTVMKTYALDVVLLTIAGSIIIKGYNDGILNGINTVGISVVKFAAIVGAMYLPFSVWAASGGMLEFLTIGAENIAAKIPLPLPATVTVPVVKVGFSIVLAIIAWGLVKVVGYLFERMLDYVDDNPNLWKVDGFVGAIIYIVVMALVLAVILLLMYSVEFFGTCSLSTLFVENSSITGGAFQVMDATIKPFLEKVRTLFTVRAG